MSSEPCGNERENLRMRLKIVVLCFAVLGIDPAFTTAMAHEGPAQDLSISPDESKVSPAVVGKLQADRRALLEAVYGAPIVDARWTKVAGGDSVVALHKGASRDILIFRLDPRGRILQDETIASIRQGGYKYTPDVVADLEGGCLVLWRQTDPSGFIVRRLSSIGSTRWTAMIAKNDALVYDTALTPAGALVLAFTGPDSVSVRRIEPDGRIGWKGNDGILSREGFANNPVTLRLLRGGREAVVIWYRLFEEDQKQNVVLAQRIRLDDGSPLWKTPVALGPAPKFGLNLPRKVQVVVGGEAIEALLYRRVAMDVQWEVEDYKVRVDRNGSVNPVKK